MAATYTQEQMRVFIFKDDEPVHIPGIALYSSVNDNQGWLEVSGDFPSALDTIFPQDLFLVYQQSEQDDDFFNEHKSGCMLILWGFQLSCKFKFSNMIVRNLETGEVHYKEPEYVFKYRKMDRKMVSE